MALDARNFHPDKLMKYREFAADPEAVIDSVNATGEQICVTRMGRFLFLIDPLDQSVSPND